MYVLVQWDVVFIEGIGFKFKVQDGIHRLVKPFCNREFQSEIFCLVTDIYEKTVLEDIGNILLTNVLSIHWYMCILYITGHYWIE